ncbi:hypothetical protein [Streptomyces sp. 3211.6]|uniref:hypothetical protein n=1 Tax=Streptomyces sp. 3211.6 TaxID=1938845 RepID=UPI001651222A|nr:hypothetical protein [Streptomyces sp. 3211.6]
MDLGEGEVGGGVVPASAGRDEHAVAAGDEQAFADLAGAGGEGVCSESMARPSWPVWLRVRRLARCGYSGRPFSMRLIVLAARGRFLSPILVPRLVQSIAAAAGRV